MAELETEYSAARRLVREGRALQERLEAYEKGGNVPPEVPLKLGALCQELGGRVETIQSLWRRLAIHNSSLWKRKAEQLSTEHASLKETVDSYRWRDRQKKQREVERAELFRRTNGISSARSGAQVISSVDAERRAHDSADNIQRTVEGLMNKGGSILSSLYEQRERFKGMQRKLFDVLNSIGLGQSLLRVAERRQFRDKLLVYGGMLVITVVALGLVFWTKASRARAQS